MCALPKDQSVNFFNPRQTAETLLDEKGRIKALHYIISMRKRAKTSGLNRMHGFWDTVLEELSNVLNDRGVTP